MSWSPPRKSAAALGLGLEETWYWNRKICCTRLAPVAAEAISYIFVSSVLPHCLQFQAKGHILCPSKVS